jgi:hypothetical protein
LNKGESDQLLIDAATAVLRQLQHGLSQRWRRLARETVAAIQKIEEKLEESVSHCMQVSNNDKLKQAQVPPGTLCFCSD